MEKLEAAAAAAGKKAETTAVPRSPTTLLVKNLPFSVTQQELQVLFIPGSIDKELTTKQGRCRHMITMVVSFKPRLG